MKKTIAAFFIITVLLFSSVQSLAFSTVYNAENETVNVSGSFSENSYVKLYILPEDVQIGLLNADSINRDDVFILVEKTDADGILNVSFTLNEQTYGKRYNVYAENDGNVYFGVVLPSDKNELNAFLNKLNAADNSQWENCIIENSPVNTEAMNKYSKEITEYMLQFKPKNGYGVYEFVNRYTLAEGLCRWKQGEINLAKLVENYGGYAGIGYESFDELNSDEQTKLTALLENADVFGAEFQDIYNEKYFVMKCCLSQSESILKTLVENYISANNIKMPVYSGISDSYKLSQIYSHVYELRKNFQNAREILDAVEVSAKQAVSDDSGREPGSGGTGGSGISGGGSAGGNGAFSGVFGTGTVTPEKPDFNDISGHWAADEITAMQSRGYINGYADKSFKPNADITRAEFVKIIVSMFGAKKRIHGRFFRYSG